MPVCAELGVTCSAEHFSACSSETRSQYRQGFMVVDLTRGVVDVPATSDWWHIQVEPRCPCRRCVYYHLLMAGHYGGQSMAVDFRGQGSPFTLQILAQMCAVPVGFLMVGPFTLHPAWGPFTLHPACVLGLCT